MREPISFPTIIVIFGATGDLVAKKIAPALFHLCTKQKLPALFQVIGFARRDWTNEQFREHIREILKPHLADETRDQLDPFLNLFTYHQGNFVEGADYRRLATNLGQVDGEWKTCSNKLFYLAVPPESMQPIFEHISASKLTDPCGPDEGWTRIIVEKPIGKDAASSEALDGLMGSMFREEQIYRIDHYLAKEMVQNMLSFRFSNNWFDYGWNAECIERIDIRLHEQIGVETRGAFYDGLGALRDVGQNHLLQMLAFATMDHPESYTAEAIRSKRAELLKTIRIPSPDEITQTSVRAQYDGYQSIPGVNPTSTTETFFRVQLSLDHPKWKGIPITLESGKRIDERRKDVQVTFKHPTPCLCPPGSPHHLQNSVTFSLEPEERVTIRFWAKKPGLEFAVEERQLDCLLRDSEKRSQYVEEYERLLLDCIAGDQTLFLRTDEVQAMWRIIDPIVAAWEANLVPLKNYVPDTYPSV